MWKGETRRSTGPWDRHALTLTNSNCSLNTKCCHIVLLSVLEQIKPSSQVWPRDSTLEEFMRRLITSSWPNQGPTCRVLVGLQQK